MTQSLVLDLINNKLTETYTVAVAGQLTTHIETLPFLPASACNGKELVRRHHVMSFFRCNKACNYGAACVYTLIK